jgi:hypothetical protein
MRDKAIKNRFSRMTVLGGGGSVILNFSLLDFNFSHPTPNLTPFN